MANLATKQLDGVEQAGENQDPCQAWELAGVFGSADNPPPPVVARGPRTSIETKRAATSTGHLCRVSLAAGRPRVKLGHQWSEPYRRGTATGVSILWVILTPDKTPMREGDECRSKSPYYFVYRRLTRFHSRMGIDPKTRARQLPGGDYSGVESAKLASALR